MNLFIINTNKSSDRRYEREMLDERKCSAYRSTKGEIAKIKKDDKVLLYSNGVGIIAKGVADGKLQTKEDKGELDAEYFMSLNDFQKFIHPIPYGKILEIIQKVEPSFKRPFSVTAIKFDSTVSTKIWDEVNKYCLKETNADKDHPKYEEENEGHYFWLSSRPSIWSVSEIKNGETVFYTAYNEKGNKRRIFNAFQIAQPKDKVIFYETTPRKEIVALGEVVEGLHKETQDGFTEPIEGVSFRYIRDIEPISWSQIIEVEELAESSPVINGAQGSLFELTKDEFETILALEPEEDDIPDVEVPRIDFTSPISIGNLYFEDEDIIKKQIQTALKNGKNIILTGPPGTGKSKLAKEICRCFDIEYRMTTATSDWSTFETIGGNRPEADGTLSFHPGLFLSCFKDQRTYQPQNQWLIIDEMNRADIDKAFGSLFSALTGDDITLQYAAQSGNQVVLRTQKEGKSVPKNDYEYVIPTDWRLIGTMNTFDKASLYEMSYAFMRRFAFIPIGIPKNITEELIESYLEQWGIENYEYIGTLTEIWKIINQYRQIGPAIVEDLARYTEEEGDFTSAIILYVMPQFEGLIDSDIIGFVQSLSGIEKINVEQMLLFTYDFFQIKE